MKKILLIFAITITALTSCSKESPTGCITCTDGEKATFTLNFHTDGFATQSRAFFDDSGVSEPWEKMIRSATIHIYDLRDKSAPVFSKYYPESQIGNLSYSVELPIELLGVECEILAIANDGNIQSTSYDALLEHTERYGLNYYNDASDFHNVANGCIRPVGFAMSGTQKFTLTSLSGQTVSVQLRRTVAKIAFKTRFNPELIDSYGNSTLILLGVVINYQYGSMALFSECGQGSRYQYNQSPAFIDGEYCNLMYFYPNSGSAGNNLSRLCFFVVEDKDGDPATIHDQVQHWLYHPLELSGDAEIKRNAYYRISATINSLDAPRSATQAVTVVVE